MSWRSSHPINGLIHREQISPLTIDTSKIKDRYMVNVGTVFWVVSEKMAELMDNWRLTGYDLRPVIHKGADKGKQPAHSFPPWSKAMTHYYFATEEQNKCKNCRVKGRVAGFYTYNKEDIKSVKLDVFHTAEWSHKGKYVYRKTLFSKAFRNLILEHKISKDVRGVYNKKYGSKDWVFEPTIIVEGK